MRRLAMVALPGSMLLAGCSSTLPLVFVDRTSVGISASTDTGVEVSVGFDTKSAAIVPVGLVKKDKDGNVAEIVPLKAENGNVTDAYSTFGNFNSSTRAEAVTVSVGLGRFFATGVAAQEIAKESLNKSAKMPSESTTDKDGGTE